MPRGARWCAGSRVWPTCSSRTPVPASWTGWISDTTELAATNPRLIYASISGYGQSGPRAGAPAMDQAVQAASGLMAKTGFPDGPPVRTGAAVADFSSAAFAALGVLGALRQRDQTGRGQHVDLSMLDVLTALVWDEPVDHYASSGMPVRTGNADPRGAPINVYPAADGWVAVTLTTSEQWKQLVVLLDRPEWADELPTIRERAQHGAEIDDAFASWSRRLPAAEVERLLLEIGVPASVVREPVAARDDEQLAHRGLLEPLHHPDASDPSGFLGPRLPIAFEGRAEHLPAGRAPRHEHRRGAHRLARPRSRRARPPARRRRMDPRRAAAAIRLSRYRSGSPGRRRGGP